MYQRVGSVLIVSIAFGFVLFVLIEFGRSIYVDTYFGGGVVSADLPYITTATILGLLSGGGAWLAELKKSKIPLVVIPLSIVIALTVGYGSTASAFNNASSRYTILTDDCFYDDAIAYHAGGGVFVLWGGKTAFHPLEDVRSIKPLVSLP